MKEKLTLTKEGYCQYLDEINKLKNKLENNATAGSEAFRNAIGDGWHDNFAFEDTMREEKKLAFTIQKMLANLNNIKIIKETKINKNIININDIIELKLTYANDDYEIGIFKLTGNYQTNPHDQFQEITLNSLLGEAIYHQLVGTHTEYKVNNTNIKVDILRKVE